MSDNKIELKGIFSEGYGIIPKKLMKMDIHKNMKLLLAYMLSFTGGGKNSCFPSYDKIAKDLHMSKSTVSQNINNCIEAGFLTVKKRFVDKNKFKKANEYILKILDPSFVYCTDDSTQYSTTNSTQSVLPIVHNEYCNNNTINNNTINNNTSDIDKIYKAYPSKCVVRGTSTGKSHKCKNQIKSLLKKDHDDLLEIINRYVKECKDNKIYMKNFSTFLNNLPDNSDNDQEDNSDNNYGMCEAEIKFHAEQRIKDAAS